MIVAFCGKAGAGKSTAAHELVQAFGFARISFADPIRRMLQSIGLAAADLGPGKQEPLDLLGGKTPRHAMQTLGYEWGRQQIGPDIWVRQWLNAVVDGGARNVVCDDVRFLNEVEAVHSLGGRVILIERERTNRMDHPSERGGFEPDGRIVNGGSEEKLREAARAVVSMLKAAA